MWQLLRRGAGGDQTVEGDRAVRRAMRAEPHRLGGRGSIPPGSRTMETLLTAMMTVKGSPCRRAGEARARSGNHVPRMHHVEERTSEHANAARMFDVIAARRAVSARTNATADAPPPPTNSDASHQDNCLSRVSEPSQPTVSAKANNISVARPTASPSSEATHLATSQHRQLYGERRRPKTE